MKILILILFFFSIACPNQKELEKHFELNGFVHPLDEKNKNENLDSLFALHYLRKASFYITNNNDDSVRFFFDKALYLINDKDIAGLLDQYYYNYSGWHAINERSFEAIINLKKAVKIANDTKDSSILPRLYTNLALIWSHLEDDTKFLEYFNKSITINKTQNLLQNNILLWQKYYEYNLYKGDTIEVKNTVSNILKVGEEMNDFLWTPLATEVYANTLIELGCFDSAKVFLDKLKPVADTIYYNQLAYSIYRDHLRYYIEKEDITNAKTYLNYINQIEINLASNMATELRILKARLFILEDKFDLANNEFNDFNIEMIKTSPSKQGIEAYKILIEIAKELGDLNIVETYQEELKSLEEKLRYEGQQKSHEIEKLSIKMKQRELEYENLEYKNKVEVEQNRVRILYSFVVIVVLISFSIIMLIRNKNKKNLLKEQKKKNELEKELLNKILSEKENNLKEKTKQLSDLIEDNKKLNNDLSDVASKIDQPSLDKLIIELKENGTSKDYWNQFEVKFIELYPNFFNSLKKDYVDLTQTELKVLAFIKMNFTSKEIANVFGIEPGSVDKHRSRARKKFELNKEDDLLGFLSKYNS